MEKANGTDIWGKDAPKKKKPTKKRARNLWRIRRTEFRKELDFGWLEGSLQKRESHWAIEKTPNQEWFFSFLRLASGTVQNYREEKNLKELDKLDHRNSPELLGFVKDKNDKRTELVERAFIWLPLFWTSQRCHSVLDVWKSLLGGKTTTNHKIVFVRLLN